MRIPLILAVVLLILQLATDTYLFVIAWRRIKKIGWAKFQIAESIFFLIYVIFIFCLPVKDGQSDMLRMVMWLILVYIAVYGGKLMFVLFDLLASAPLLFKRKRLRYVSWLGAAAGVATGLTVLWGAFINRFRIQVTEQTIVVDNLPESFENYRIVQISDLHVGTYGSDDSFINKLVDKVNSLEPDMIVFTGDLVNQQTAELDPFVSALSRLNATDGTFSILGNHDYGDYHNWASDQAKEENMERLMDLQIEMGWRLLTNSAETIYGSNPADSIVIIGVHNWGDPPFPQLGDLKGAYPELNDSTVKILLTHNPIHWKQEVEPSDSCNIRLTLSGHTHAMQFMLGGFSPAAWRYPRCWAGRYDSADGKRTLYVNIGTGTVGLPMRIGATPEITVFTLTSTK